MSWYHRLWGVLTSPVGGEPKPEPEPSGFSENFVFEETVRTSVGAPQGQKSPRPNEAIVELYSDDGELLVLERLEVKPLPRGPYLARGKTPATYVNVSHGATDRAHQEFTLTKADADFREPLFQRDFSYAKFWWSCENG